MLLLNHKVPVPEHNVVLTKRDGNVYCFELTDPWKNPDGSRNRNRKKKMIGRLVSASAECTEMFPNENYYRLRSLPLPEIDYSKVSVAGRKSAYAEGEGSTRYPAFSLLAHAILLKTGAMEILESCFDAVRAAQIAFLAAHYASGHTSLENLDFHSLVHNVFTAARGLDCRAAGELMSKGIKHREVREFFKRWLPEAAGDDAVAYDVTALTTKAHAVIEAEYGYTHGGPALPQVNYALLCNERTGMPLFYAHYHGSLSDKKNLLFVLRNALERNLPGRVLTVMDKGFASKTDLAWLREKRINFLMGVPATFKEVTDKLALFGSRADFPFSSRCTDLRRDGTYADDICFAQTEAYEWNGERLNLHLYRNEVGSAVGRAAFTVKIAACQESLKKTGALPQDEIYAKARECLYKIGTGKGARWELDENKAAEKIRRIGCFALFSNPEAGLDAQGALLRYRQREIDEAVFNCLKTDLHLQPLRVWSDDALKGKFFVLFIAAIIRRGMLNETRDLLRDAGKSFGFITDVLGSIETEIGSDGKPRLTSALPKTARAILCRILDPELIREFRFGTGLAHKAQRKSGKKCRGHKDMK